MTKLMVASLLIVSGFASAQALDPALLTKPLADSWPTYSGDYSGKRYSSLTQINQSNVKNLTLAWVGKLTQGPGGRNTIMGGESDIDTGFSGGSLKASIFHANRTLPHFSPVAPAA